MKFRVLAFIVAIVITCAGWSQVQHRQLLFLVEQTKDRPAYHLDDADVSADPSRGLGLVIEKTGKDWPLAIAVDGRLSINTLRNAGALAGKVGFVNIRYQAFHHEDRKMIELSFGKDLIPSEPGSYQVLRTDDSKVPMGRLVTS